jgi:hypothetical protein
MFHGGQGADDFLGEAIVKLAELDLKEGHVAEVNAPILVSPDVQQGACMASQPKCSCICPDGTFAVRFATAALHALCLAVTLEPASSSLQPAHAHYTQARFTLASATCRSHINPLSQRDSVSC